MNDHDHDPAGDAQFDEFLLGKGELSEWLQAMPQPQPSAELDEKIMADAQAALAAAAAARPVATAPVFPIFPTFPTAARDATAAKDITADPSAKLVDHAKLVGLVALPWGVGLMQARPLKRVGKRGAAANDSGTPGARRKGGWRVPLGVAASLVLSLSVVLKIWQDDGHRQSITEPSPVNIASEVAQPRLAMPAGSANIPAPTSPPPPVLQASGALAEKEVDRRHQEGAKKLAKQAAPARILDEVVVAGTPQTGIAGGVESKADARLDGTVTAKAKNIVEPAPVFATKPMPPAREEDAVQKVVSVTSPRVFAAPAAPKLEVADKRSVADTPAENALGGEPKREARVWLSQIEKLVKDNKPKEALEAWQKFREAYPDFVVEPAIEKQIEAFRARK